MRKRGFEGMMVTIVGVVIAVIILYSVLQPVTNSMIQPNWKNDGNNATFNNLSAYSTAYMVSQQLPTFIAIVGLVAIAGVAISMFRS